MRSLKKQKEQSCEERRQVLVEEINEIREKISQLDELQQQIETIEELIKLEQSKRSKMGSSSYSSAKPKLENKYKANSNSNKKIKIYELNKKLEGRQKEYKDRHVSYLGRLRKQEEQMAMIGDTNQDIRKQRDNSNELERLHSSLVADINRIQEKCNQQQAMLLNEKQVLSLYGSQKIRRIQEIKRLKKIINQSAEKTEPDDMAYSVNELDQYQADDAKIKPLAFRLELTEHNSPNLLSENRKQEEILIQDEVQEQALIPAYISFKKSHNHRLTQSPQMNSLNDSKAEHYSKEIGKSYEQLENEVILLEEKIQKDKKLYQNLIESVSLVKRGNRNLEASAKHMIVTLDLLKNRLENVVRNNEQETRQLVDNIEKYNGIYSKMRAKDGERGELRGKLGIKVENTRILGIINEQITLDLLKVGDKAPLLKNLSAQCFQLVKRFAEPERLISQNLNDY